MELNTIEVWQPRWHDRMVLIPPYKVAAHNKIIFTQAKSLEGKVYYASKQALSERPKENNGTVDCYVIALDDLELMATPENNQQRKLI